MLRLLYDSVGCRELNVSFSSEALSSTKRLQEGCGAEEEDHAKYREAELILRGQRGGVTQTGATIRVLLTYSEYGRARKEGFCLRNVCRHVRV